MNKYNTATRGLGEVVINLITLTQLVPFTDTKYSNPFNTENVSHRISFALQPPKPASHYMSV